MHKDQVKPNFHWALHIFDQILDFGPVYNFWAFTSERLNKVLKSYNSNHHAGGALETSLLRSFVRDARLRQLTQELSNSDGPEASEYRSLRESLNFAEHDGRGLVSVMAETNAGETEQGLVAFM